MKRYWKAGLAAAVVLGIAATVTGIVAAQTGTSTPGATSTQAKSTATASSNPDATSTAKNGAADATPEAKGELRDDFLNSLVDNLGVSRDALDKALAETGNDMVDKALADGKITQAEADAIKAKIASGDFPPFGFGFRHGYKDGFQHGFHAGVKLDDLANFLGVDVSVVTDGLRNNQSLAQIAEAHGKTRDELKSYIISNVTDRLKQEVKDGNITQAQADEKLQNVKDNVDNLIDHAGLPFHGPGPGFGMRGGPDMCGPGGYDNDDEGAPPAPTNSTQTSSLVL